MYIVFLPCIGCTYTVKHRSDINNKKLMFAISLGAYTISFTSWCTCSERIKILQRVVPIKYSAMLLKQTEHEIRKSTGTGHWHGMYTSPKLARHA